MTSAAAGSRAPVLRTDGHVSVDSKTIEELMYVTLLSEPLRCARIAASHVAAMIRSFVASRSYAYVWKYEIPPIIAAPAIR